MVYATQDDIVELYGEDELLKVAEDDNAEGTIDVDRAARGLADASGEMDGYIGNRHPLPLAITTPTLRQICVDIALYRLALKAGPRTAEHRTRYEDAIRKLERIADGKATIGAPEAPQEEPEEEDAAYSWGFFDMQRG